MPQLHFYVTDKVASKVKQQAQTAGLSTSRFLADMVQRQVLVADWPEDFFDVVVGGWQGEPLQRPSQGDFESRDMMI